MGPVNLTIDPTDSVPIYRQIRDRIVEAIAEGRLPPGTALAPVRKLAAEFRINPSTVVKAYDMLRSEGFIQTSRNAGSFVTALKPPHPEFMKGWGQKVLPLLAEAKARGANDDEILDTCTKLLGAIRNGSTEPHE